MTKPETNFPETQASLLVKLQTDDDEAAWQEFVAIYRPVIYRMACRRGMQDADAQDLAQKVLVSVSTAIESWEPRETPFRHWLRKVASNAILKMLTRQPQVPGRGGTTVIQMLGNAPADKGEVQRELRLEHQREIFLRAAAIVRADIAPQTWQVFELTVIEGLQIEEAAEKTGKGVGAAYAARGRVMKRLKQVVAKMQDSGE